MTNDDVCGAEKLTTLNLNFLIKKFNNFNNFVNDDFNNVFYFIFVFICRFWNFFTIQKLVNLWFLWVND